MAQGKLTALALSWAHKADKELTLSDGGNLYFRKRKEGGSSWILRYRFLGKLRKIRIGTYPDMSLAEARIEARKARVMVDKQEDPLVAREEARTEFKRRESFSQLCEDWFASEILGRGIKKHQAARGLLNMYIIPGLGKIATIEIQPMDITRMLDGVKRKYPSTANQLLRTTRRIFSFAVRRRIVLTNPTFDLSQRMDAGGVEKSRSRALNLDELARLFAALRNTQAFGVENLLTTKLLLATCVRKGELIGARWEEFDLQGRTAQGPVWHLPGARTKTGEQLDIPLVPKLSVGSRACVTLAGRATGFFRGDATIAMPLSSTRLGTR